MITKGEKERVNKARLREAEEVGCHGLIRGVARNLHTQDEWEAETAYKNDGPFYCPVCYSDVVIRKCSEKTDHFAHKSRLSPVLGPKEMLLHNACTKEICGLLVAKFPDGRWEIERPIRDSKKRKTPTLVPDISGLIGTESVAIEVQVSALTIPRIVQRTCDYAKWGISLIWVVPLRAPLGTLPFRPRLFERYLHSLYVGRTYYWWAGQGLTLKPVHYGVAKRRIEYREWFENGQHESAGGYDAPYKTIKTPEYGPDLLLSEHYRALDRDPFTPENERKEVPACRIWVDTVDAWWSTT